MHPASDKKNILLLSSGSKVALAQIAKQAAQEMGSTLHASDTHANVPTKQFVDKFSIFEFSKPIDWIHEIISYCDTWKIGLIIPTRHSELTTLDQHRDLLEGSGTKLLLSSGDALRTSLDKLQTHSFFTAKSIPTPTTQTFEAWSQNPFYPAIAKPMSGSGSDSISILTAQSQRPPNADQLIVQSIAPGDEYTINAYVDKNGNCSCAIPHKRIYVENGEVMQAKTERIEILVENTKKVIRSIDGFLGPINLQAFYESNANNCQFIEINPRIGGGFPLAHQAGGHFLKWAIQEQLFNTAPPVDTKWTENLTMMRYREAIFT